jgi:hypothetical protein
MKLASFPGSAIATDAFTKSARAKDLRAKGALPADDSPVKKKTGADGKVLVT